MALPVCVRRGLSSIADLVVHETPFPASGGDVLAEQTPQLARKSGANVEFPPRADPQHGYQASDFIR
jgi:hypothetical protein